jgi:hypothetical protein
MALVSVNPLDEVKATDINQFKDALEGAVSGTVPFFLRTATGEDFLIRLGGNATSRKLSVQDSDAAEVFKVDADGNLTAAGSFSPGTLILPSSTTPTPTVEGDIQWDSNDNHLVIGDGSGQVNIGPVASVLTTTGDILYASSAATLARLAASTDGYVLTATGAGSAPAWEALPAGETVIVKDDGNQTADNTVTMANVTQMVFPVLANSTYTVTLALKWKGWILMTAGGIRWNWTYPSGANWGMQQSQALSANIYHGYGVGTWEIEGATGQPYAQRAFSAGTDNNPVGFWMRNDINIETAGTAGNFQLEFAQAGAAASKITTLMDGTWLSYKLIA